jgi:hypothetical protein
MIQAETLAILQQDKLDNIILARWRHCNEFKYHFKREDPL